MLFYHFFKTHIKSNVRITLKNKMIISGVMENIDSFLNIKLTDVNILENEDGQNIFLKNGFCYPKVCSIRGSAIKCINLTKNGAEKYISGATRLRIAFEK